MLPEETAQAALDLNAAAVLPSHAGRFVMAKHSWNEPFIRLALTSRDKPYRLLTPKLGKWFGMTGKHSNLMSGGIKAWSGYANDDPRAGDSIVNRMD